jgi:hypothetical protein
MSLKPCAGFRKSQQQEQTPPALAAEVVYGPHNDGEDDAEEDAGGEGKVDGPSAAAPGEVAGETAEREMEAAEAEDDQAGDDEKNAEEDEGAA